MRSWSNNLRNFDERKSLSTSNILGILIVIAVFWILGQINFLLFHTLIEFFTIVVGAVCFLVAWRMREFQPHEFLMVLGCGYLGVSGLDLIHTLIYKGIGVFPTNDANYPTQLWLAARYVEAGVLLTAPIFLVRKADPRMTLTIVGVISVGFALSIFIQIFPDAFVEGEGLTDFKVISEYVIILILIFAGAHLYLRRSLITRSTLKMAGASILLTIAAEIAFTLYIDVYGASNIIGHIFKFISFWIILEMIFSKAIRQPLQALDEILWGTNVGTWEWNIQTGETRFNERWAEIVGYTLEELQPTSIQTWVDFCHPDDLQHSNELLQKHFAGEVDHYHCEARMRHKEGHWVWVLDRGKVAEWSNDGKPIRISGTHTDITDQKRLEEERALNLAKFESLLSTAPVGFIAVNREFKIILCNINAAQMFGCTVEEMVGLEINKFVPREVHAKHEKLMQRFISGPDRSIAMSDWRIVNGITLQGKAFPMLAYLRKLTIDDTTLTTFICQDMTDVKDQELRLRELLDQTIEARARAEAANQSKSTFLASMSHELRSPLNAIIGFSEMIQMAGVANIPTDKVDGYIGDIRTSGVHLLSLINDILDISKLEADALSINMQSLNLNHLAAEAVRSFLTQRTERQVEIDIDVAMDLEILADRRAAYQCILNLISNAMKFAPRGSRVKVVANTEDRAVRISVQDSGPGFNEALIARIGEPFIHAGDAMLAKKAGAGLGLAITMRLMSRMNGELHVRNLEPVGAAVDLIFPISSFADQD